MAFCFTIRETTIIIPPLNLNSYNLNRVGLEVQSGRHNIYTELIFLLLFPGRKNNIQRDLLL